MQLKLLKSYGILMILFFILGKREWPNLVPNCFETRIQQAIQSTPFIPASHGASYIVKGETHAKNNFCQTM